MFRSGLPLTAGMHRDYQTLISLLKLLLFFAMAFCIAVSPQGSIDVIAGELSSVSYPRLARHPAKHGRVVRPSIVVIEMVELILAYLPSSHSRLFPSACSHVVGRSGTRTSRESQRTHTRLQLINRIMGFNLGIMVLGLAYFMRVSPAWLASELKSSYKLASMFLPRTAWLYTNTKITLCKLFRAFCGIMLTFSHLLLAVWNWTWPASADK